MIIMNTSWSSKTGSQYQHLRLLADKPNAGLDFNMCQDGNQLYEFEARINKVNIKTVELQWACTYTRMKLVPCWYGTLSRSWRMERGSPSQMIKASSTRCMSPTHLTPPPCGKSQYPLSYCTRPTPIWWNGNFKIPSTLGQVGTALLC